MKMLALALALIVPVMHAIAQRNDWSLVDWSSVSADRIKSLASTTESLSWQNVELSPANDPRHHFPPGTTSALLLAVCYSTRLDVVDALIASGARVDGSGADSPLLYAALYNPNPAIVKELIDKGADVRKDLGYAMLARPALTYAAQYNPSAPVIAVLVAAGAAVNAKVSTLDNMGFTPLMYAAQYNDNPAILRELLKDGAKIEATDAMGRTALIFAAQYNKNPAMLTTLIEEGAQVNFVSRDYYNVNWTPLMYAAASASNPLPKVGILLAAGADPQARSKEGKTALDYAMANDLVPRRDAAYIRLVRATGH